MRFVNSGTQTVFFRMMYSAGNVATVASSCPLLANTVETFNVPQGVVGISFIAAGTGSTIYVTPGESA